MNNLVVFINISNTDSTKMVLSSSDYGAHNIDNI